MALSTNKTHPENSPEGQQAKADAQAADSSLAEVQAKADADAERGYRGIEADVTPNENYTVAGVTSGAPTPETDKAHAKVVRDHLMDVQKSTNGVTEQ